MKEQAGWGWRKQHKFSPLLRNLGGEKRACGLPQQIASQSTFHPQMLLNMGLSCVT